MIFCITLMGSIIHESNAIMKRWIKKYIFLHDVVFEWTLFKITFGQEFSFSLNVLDFSFNVVFHKLNY